MNILAWTILIVFYLFVVVPLFMPSEFKYHDAVIAGVIFHLLFIVFAGISLSVLWAANVVLS